MVVAISFLEAPIKFRAPGVTVPIGLSIGRLVFKALNGVELVLLLALAATVYADRPGATAFIVLVSVGAVLLVQVVVVRPLLSKRSNRVLAGEERSRSQMHWFYIVLELAKVVPLIVLSFALTAGVVACLP
jgi:hypothetical protein